jgi:hypothetical protein
VRLILSTFPAPEETPEEWAIRADFRAEETRKLEAWRARLRDELNSMIVDINGRDPKSLDLEVSYGEGGKLVEDVDVLTRAISDANENLQVASPPQRWTEFKEPAQDRARYRP